MINRQNKKLTNQYLHEILNDNDIGHKTFKVKKTRLTQFLTFADKIVFKDLPDKANGKNFKNYLKSEKARRDNKSKPLSSEYLRQVSSTTRLFLEWLQDQPGYGKITNKWVRSFSTHRRDTQSSTPDGYRIYFSIDEIEKIAKTPVFTLNQERTKAAIIFLFLTGMRIGAFVTLPIRAVDISQRIVFKYPELGVETKFNAKGKARIANIPFLLKIVGTWDQKVRSIFPPDGKWFAPISPQTGLLDPNVPTGKQRDKGFRDDLEAFLKNAGVDYKSPHKLRHGFIRYGRDHAKHDMRSLEAIAHNTGQTLATMLKYGKLSEEDAFREFDDIYSALPSHTPNLKTHQQEKASVTKQLEQIEQVLQAIKEEL